MLALVISAIAKVAWEKNCKEVLEYVDYDFFGGQVAAFKVVHAADLAVVLD